MKSYVKPTPEEVDRAISLLSHKANHRYFFDKLDNPEWIAPLRARQFFKTPPEPTRDSTQGTIGFPIWPESQFLARMASIRPEVVLEALLEIPDVGNISVYSDLIDCTMKMPLSELPAKNVDSLVKLLKHWGESKYVWFRLPEKLFRLSIHLALHNRLEDSEHLARTVLAVQPDENYYKRADSKKLLVSLPNPKPRMGHWEHEQILKKQYPEFVKLMGIRALRLLCDLLEGAIELSRAAGEPPGPEDFSHIWRSVIESENEYQHYDVKNMLVTAIHRTGAQLVKADQKVIGSVVETLILKKWWIFRRIALVLLKDSGGGESGVIAGQLMDKEVFDSRTCKREYSLLLSNCFGNLSISQKDFILGWLRAGPDVDKYKERARMNNFTVSESDIADFSAQWLHERLSWIEPFLSGDLLERYVLLDKELGPAPDFKSVSLQTSAVWVGPTSPLTKDELLQKPTQELVEYLRRWKPTEAPRDSSPEGLGRILSEVVKEHPEEFVKNAVLLKGLNPTYIRQFFSGLESSLDSIKELKWEPVLELMEWVLSQADATPKTYSRTWDSDPHWGWTRKSIASLLGRGFETKTCAIPITHRGRVWNLLMPLTADDDPTPADEAQYGPPNMDAATYSINTTRGEAMHTVIKYALWVRSNSTPPTTTNSLSIELTPEVQAALEGHLDPTVEPSVAVRAVYGWWFPQLVFLDRQWASSQSKRIFPLAPASARYFEASWRTYIRFCNPYTDVFDILEPQYQAAVSSLNDESNAREQPDFYIQRLVGHLMSFYWGGTIELDNPLMDTFWKGAPDEARGYAIEFFGRSLQEGEKPAELERLKKLWSTRLSSAMASKSTKEFKKEMSGFGWWFTAGVFSDEWAIEQLLLATKIGGGSQIDHLVAKRVAQMSKNFPSKCVHCLRELAEADADGWSIYGWLEECKTVIRIGLESEDKQVSKETKDFANYLGTRGYVEFRSLLPKH